MDISTILKQTPVGLLNPKMKIFIQINDDGSMTIRARAESEDGTIGDMIQIVEPGQELILDGPNLTYDDLIKHGNGEMNTKE